MTTDEDIERMRHEDFKKSKHSKECRCGYCWMKNNNVNILGKANNDI